MEYRYKEWDPIILIPLFESAGLPRHYLKNFCMPTSLIRFLFGLQPNAEQVKFVFDAWQAEQAKNDISFRTGKQTRRRSARTSGLTVVPLFKRLGFEQKKYPRQNAITLGAYMKYPPCENCVVDLKRHITTIIDGHVVDTYAPSARCKIWGVWEFTGYSSPC